jgi:hypothetical protein
LTLVGTAGQSGPVPGAHFSATDTPAAIDGVEVAVFDGEAVLFDASSSMVHRLGAIAGAVWLCCDGSTDVAMMIEELTDIFQLPGSELAGAVHETLERFADEGLLAGHHRSTRLGLTPETTVADDGTAILTGPPDP